MWAGGCFVPPRLPPPSAHALIHPAVVSHSQVHVGDCVISVNGAFMLDLDYAAVVTAISKGGKKISFVLGSPDQMFEKDDVEVPPVT